MNLSDAGNLGQIAGAIGAFWAVWVAKRALESNRGLERETLKARMDAKQPVLSFVWRDITTKADYDQESPELKFAYRIVNMGDGPAWIESVRLDGQDRTSDIGPKYDSVIGPSSCPPYNDTTLWVDGTPPPWSEQDNPTRLELVYRDVYGRRFETVFENLKSRTREIVARNANAAP